MVGVSMVTLLGCVSNQSSYAPAQSAGASHPQSYVGGSAPLAFDATASPPARAVSFAEADPVTSSDVVRWSASGMRQDIIIDRIERSPSVFHLTAADENALRDKGVSEVVIQEMKATARR